MKTASLLALYITVIFAIAVVPAVVSHALACLVVALMVGTVLHLAAPRPRRR